MIETFRKHFVTPGDWHFHKRCSSWPNQDYVEDDLPDDPTALCVECIRRYCESRSQFAAALQAKSKSTRSLLRAVY